MKKILCMLLSMLLVMQILPMSVFAEEYTATDTSITDTDTSEDPLVILSENESKRDYNTKHYLLSDGSYNAVVYPVPVHYQKDGESAWIEIDNTLVENVDENENVYYTPSESPVDVKFAKYGDSDNLVSYTVNGYDISWSYEDGDFGLFQKHSKLSKLSKKRIEIFKNKTDHTDVIENIESSAKYDHFYDNVDIEYTITSEGVKENIVLNKKSAQNVFFVKYNIGKLTAKQTDERLITLYDGENAVVQISAPYMIDDASVSSDAISFEIVSQKNGVLRVRLTADSEWLNAEDREYPVTVDPYIFEFNEDISNDATYISKNISSSQYPHGSLIVGKCADYGISRSYLKFSLPSLSAGDMVIGGTLYLYQFSGTNGYSTETGASSLRINATRVTSAWSANGVIYSNTTPSYNSTVIDSIEVSSVSKMTQRTFDIGKIVKGWYNNEYTNYGIRLHSATENDSTYAIFASTDYDSGSHPPILVVSYLNNKGLEDRWTYHSQSLGESGTSYINDCTGNLVFVAPVCNTVGNNAPASVNLVYNGYLVDSVGSAAGKCGRGWRFDFEQNITKIAEDSDLYDANYRYIYTDADGTEHYFRVKDENAGTYEDEEGMNLTLKVGSDGDSKYTLESAKTGAKNIYNSNGNIVKICDADGNYCKYTYNSSNQLSYITDGYGRKIYVGFNANGYVTSITDPSNRVVSISYTSSPAKISKITYPDGAYTKFEYNDNNCLSKCTAIDKTSISYSYHDTNKYCVDEVKELGTDGTAGGSLNMNYRENRVTEFTDSKNRMEKYIFDQYGRTVTVFDSESNCDTYQYTAPTSKKDDTRKGDKNKLVSVSSSEKYVNNMLKNHSFESGTTGWTLSGTSTGSVSVDSTNGKVGKYGLKISKTATGGTTAYQKVYVTDGMLIENGTYTFSAYVKTSTVNTNAYIYMNCVGANISEEAQKTASSVKITNKQDDYKRISVTLKIPEGTDYVNFAVSATGTGTVWFDCLQVEAGSVANEYNLLENSSMNDTASTAWTGLNLGTNDGYASSAYRIYGEPDKNKAACQTVVLNIPASECAMALSGSASGHALPAATNRYFGLNIVFHYDADNDGVSDYHEYQTVSFEPSVATTQYTTGVVKPGKDYLAYDIISVTVRLIYFKNLNSVIFNNISLYLDTTGTSYTYDENGNVQSAKDHADANATFTYDNANNLVESKYQDNTWYTYTYYENIPNEHRLKSAKSEKSGITINYDYHAKGGVNIVTVSHEDFDKTIQTSTGYDEKGNYVEWEKNALGFTTNYDYDEPKGTLSSVTDSRGNITNYTYNANNDYVTSVSSGNSAVNYTYNTKRQLTDITTDTVNYKFVYDLFNNLKNVKIGSTALITNTYEEKNGNLIQSTYGNEDYVKYTYDTLDRVKAVNYNDVEKFAFVYDYSNRLARVTNNAENYTTDYTYDLSGRLIEKNRSDGAYVKTSYNEKNLATGVTYSFGGITEDISYTYDAAKDDALTQTYFSNIRSNSFIFYDALGRTEREMVVSGAYRNIIDASYTYVNRAADSTKTTGFVSGINYTTDNLSDIAYTYDALGNIKTVTYSNGVTESYAYDSLNRLVTANIGNDTYRYTYDNSGNILSKTKNNSTVAYTYGTSAVNPAWGDLLTAYNGTAINYDKIGNPLSYGNVTFTWNGRRMATYTNGDTSASYRYNEDGVRTYKNVNGIETEYFVDGSTILAQKTGDELTVFYYDGNGKRIAIKYDDTMYYYVYNLQGDVTHLLDSYGNVAGSYKYDVWGNATQINGDIAILNPFRYRGYYYDNESGLYYLNSRYYNAEWGRFINADGYVTTGQGLTSYNLFVYCGDNPVNNFDPTGAFSMAACMTLLQGMSNQISSFESYINEMSIIDATSVVCDVIEKGTNIGIKLVEYVYSTSESPNNIGAGAHAKQVKAITNSLNNASNVVSKIGNSLTAVFVVLSAYETISSGISNGDSDGKIMWDVTVDLLATAGGIAMTTIITSVASFVVPGPVGTIVGMVISFGAIQLYDYLINEPKKQVKGWVK